MSSLHTQPLPSDWVYDNLEAVRSAQALSGLSDVKLNPNVGIKTNMTVNGNLALLVIIVVLVLLSVVTYVSTGSFLATLVVISIIIGFVMILGLVGIVKVYFDKDGVLHIDYHEVGGGMSGAESDIVKGTRDLVDGVVKEVDALAGHSNLPAPSGATEKKAAPKPVVKKEVFHIGGNQYTYHEAPAVCAAHDAELATYDQVQKAFAAGGEWCAYGWTQGGMALYPTQPATWRNLQAEPTTRTACGRPGVNGGYFDPETKFGANCFGVKPENNKNIKFPQPLPGKDPLVFQSLVDRFKKIINSMYINPYNRNEWSEWGGKPSQK